MPRPRRAAEGGLIYHDLNRANARLARFEPDEEYVVAGFDCGTVGLESVFRPQDWPRKKNGSRAVFEARPRLRVVFGS
jgi:hypothetical protein